MKLRYRILSVVGVVAIAAVTSFAVAVSYNSNCGAAVAPPADTPRMKAVMSRCYGSPAVLTVEEVARPAIGDHDVLVKVRAAALNPLDWHMMRGEPYFTRLMSGFGAPEDFRAGVDFAGTVEAVGSSVTRFKPGDEVYGGGDGAFAEYVAIREDRAIVHKPANLTFEQAAAVPIAAITALQGLRDQGRLQSGHEVLINGASGGVGTFAVQIAKAMGAEVTGVCSTRNIELVRSIGADHVVDYTREDFTKSGQLYDLVLDNVSSQPVSAIRRVLKPDGVYVIVGGTSRNPWIGPMLGPIKTAAMAPFADQQMGTFMARLNASDFEVLNDLMQAGKVTPVIDRRYPLSEIKAAMAYLETGRARGKVVVNMP